MTLPGTPVSVDLSEAFSALDQARHNDFLAKRNQGSSDMVFPSSSRLIFRAWTEADMPLALSLWTDPEVTRYLGGPMITEQVQARLRLEMERQRTFGFQYWPIFFRPNDGFAGCAGLRPSRHGSGIVELGVHIARAFWSERLGEEAALAAIAYAFEVVGAEAVMAGHNPDNVPSKALIQRLGFIFSHEEPWGPQDILHLFYRLDRRVYVDHADTGIA